MSKPTRIYVDRAAGTVVLCSPALAQSQPWEATREVIRRSLAAECVESVLIDRAREMVSMRIKGLPSPEIDPPSDQDQVASPIRESLSTAGPQEKQVGRRSVASTSTTAQSALREIVARLRDESSISPPISDVYASQVRLKLQKGALCATATAGSIVHALSGRVRIRHPLLRSNRDLSRHAVATLKAIPGIRDVSASSTTGSILVSFNEAAVQPEQLLAIIETVLTSRLNELELMSGPPARRWLESGVCLGLAVASEFFMPGLAPLTAIALVGCNLPTMGRGITELATMKWRVSALYTVIMGTTLISGQFLAAALMQASITGWHGWSSRRLKRIINHLRRQAPLPIVLSGTQHRHLLEGARFPDCLIGTTVNLEQGAIVPYDGIVESGSGEFDEKFVRGIRGTAERSLGDQIFAGSRVLKGQLRMRVTAVDNETRVAKIREALLASVAGLPGRGMPTERSHSSASRIVPITFATGTAALMVGDLTTLAAVLRPDFATGPSMSERFSDFSSICHLWDEGWLVRDHETLHELAKTQTVVIARIENWPERTPEGGWLAPPLTISLDFAGRIERRTVSLSGRSLEIHEITATVEGCANYIRELRPQIKKVAVVGGRQLLSRLSQDDVIRISSTPQECIGERDYDVLGLHAQPQRFEELWKVLQETRRPMRQGWAAVVACNTLAISGAFLMGLTSLHVVLLTNIGALAASVLHNRHFQKSKRMLSLNQDPPSPDGINTKQANSEFPPFEVAAIGTQNSPRIANTSARESLSTAWNARMRAQRTTDSLRWNPGTTPVRAADVDVL